MFKCSRWLVSSEQPSIFDDLIFSISLTAHWIYLRSTVLRLFLKSLHSHYYTAPSLKATLCYEEPVISLGHCTQRPHSEVLRPNWTHMGCTLKYFKMTSQCCYAVLIAEIYKKKCMAFCIFKTINESKCHFQILGRKSNLCTSVKSNQYKMKM